MAPKEFRQRMRQGRVEINGIFAGMALPGPLRIAETRLDVGRQDEALVISYLVTSKSGDRSDCY
jgi:hypothetical protein